jgi:hypothetical protein
VVTTGVDRVWVEHGTPMGEVSAPQRYAVAEMVNRIQTLSPHTDLQKAIQIQALQLASSLGQVRMLMFAQASNSLSLPFLVVLISWVTFLFVGYGIFARLNSTIVTALLVGAFSVSGAIFLIIELNRPYSGVLRIPDTVMRNAIAMMGQP